MNVLSLIILFAFCGDGIFTFTQHFVSDDVMSWTEAGRACPGLFGFGNGTIQMAQYLTPSPQKIQVLRTLDIQESVWLDGYRFHLGCSENICEYLTVEHIIANETLKSICETGDGLTAKFNCTESDTFNLTQVTEHIKLKNISEYVQGVKLKINQVSMTGLLTQCRTATKMLHRIRIGYGRCEQKLKVLCQKHSSVSQIVTTLHFNMRLNGDDSEYIPILNRSPNVAKIQNIVYREWNEVNPSTGFRRCKDLVGFLDVKWIITTSLTGVSCVLCFVICIRLCLRNRMPLVTPRGRTNSFLSLRNRPYEDIFLNTP